MAEVPALPQGVFTFTLADHPSQFHISANMNGVAHHKRKSASVSSVNSNVEDYLQNLAINKDELNENARINREELLNTPVFSFSVRKAIEEQGLAKFSQFGLLGREVKHSQEAADPVFLNINAPWSAFICGSQGSGKSYTLSCMLEGCLTAREGVNKLPKPLAGMVFHYDKHQMGSVCEVAHLSSLKIPVKVLVPRSNFRRLEAAYKAVNPRIEVVPLTFHQSHIDAGRMLRLMAFSNGDAPLYLEVIRTILRDMAEAAQEREGIDYEQFQRRIAFEGLDPKQNSSLRLRLQVLESFMHTAKNKRSVSPTLFQCQPGSLIIVDLTDPFVDEPSAAMLFDLCLELFMKMTKGGKVVALDEAHKFMTNTSASDNLTESLLQIVRVQRHVATRVIVSTQEPTISEKFLDLCNITIVHRFSSPAWLQSLRKHLAGASRLSIADESFSDLLQGISKLRVGESLLFCPSARLHVTDGRTEALGSSGVLFLTRPRLSSDGGRSILAIR